MNSKITLSSRDGLGRVVAETTFRRSWRFNEVTGCRETGFKIHLRAPMIGVDFGDLNWFVTPPMDSSRGIVANATWNHVN